MPAEPSPFLNRELSWLSFNQRVLAEAFDEKLPLLERLKFLAITGSNLDEFFMVRVGGLQQIAAEGRNKPDLSGLTPAAQLREIARLTRQMTEDQYACLADLESRLASAGIRRVRAGDLAPKEEAFVERLFTNDILPVLTPIAVSPDRPFPILAGLRINLFLRVQTTDGPKEPPRTAVVTIPKGLARFMTLPVEDGFHFVLLEEAVARFAALLFPGQSILESVPFRIIRNADMAVREDQAADLLAQMKEILVERKQSACRVRVALLWRRQQGLV